MTLIFGYIVERTNTKILSSHFLQFPLVCESCRSCHMRYEDIAARLVTGTRHSDHIKPVLRQLHWLPVRQRVAFNIAGLVRQSLAGAAPAYLADDCHLLSDAGRRPLRSHSNDIRKLIVPRTHNKLCDRSFSAAGP